MSNHIVKLTFNDGKDPLKMWSNPKSVQSIMNQEIDAPDIERIDVYDSRLSKIKTIYPKDDHGSD